MRVWIVIALGFILLAASGCMSDGDGQYNGGTITAALANNTTGAPLNDVTREDLENPHVRQAVREAYRNGTASVELAETQAEEADAFLQRFEYYRYDGPRDVQQPGYYLVYRDKVVVVSVTKLE